MRTIEVIDATRAEVVAGRHALWLPNLQLKIPFAFGGRITKYRHDEDGYDPAETIPHELAVLRALGAQDMAPPVGNLVYIETLITEHTGAWHADPCGAWAYEMADATRLPPGRFRLDRMRAMPIVGSSGAWGDIGKPGNIVNGYLVDVRRSAWDMLTWCGGALQPLPPRPENLRELRDHVHLNCQFPPGERSEAYQDFWIAGRLERGQRRVMERAEALGFRPLRGENVLDIGTQSGGFLQYAHMRGARRLAGVDVNPAYVECARALARSCDQNICFRRMDVNAERDAFLAWVRAYYPHGVDHLLLLSLEKHLGERELFSLADAVGARRVYLETNAVGATDGPMKLWPQVKARGGRHVGDSRDRNLRRLYRIEAQHEQR